MLAPRTSHILPLEPFPSGLRQRYLMCSFLNTIHDQAHPLFQPFSFFSTVWASFFSCKLCAKCTPFWTSLCYIRCSIKLFSLPTALKRFQRPVIAVFSVSVRSVRFQPPAIISSASRAYLRSKGRLWANSEERISHRHTASWRESQLPGCPKQLAAASIELSTPKTYMLLAVLRLSFSS